MALSACDSYLDIQPVGKVIPNTVEEYRALLTTAYYQELNDRGICELRTDMAVIADDAYNINSYRDIEIWNDANPGVGTREFQWKEYYSNIYYANAIIDKRHEMTEGNQQDKDQLAGEAYLMRGYMHFLLVNLYGEPYTKPGATGSKAVPLKWDMDLESTPTRATVEEIYTAVLSDIENARKHINRQEWEQQYTYRFSTLSVDALESRVYLYMGNWTKAYDAAERVLAQKSALSNLNVPEGETPKLPGEFDSEEMITAYESVYSSNHAASLRVNPSFVEKYEEGKDLRRAAYFGTDDEGNIVPQRDGSSKFRCTFRTGELYLNAAESAAHLNRLTEARTRLLQLMKNRYTPEGYAGKEAAVNAMSQDELIAEILDERTRELAFEGHYWFDLRRTTRQRVEKEIDGKMYILEEDDARYTLRIPQTAIDANPGLLD